MARQPAGVVADLVVRATTVDALDTIDASTKVGGIALALVTTARAAGWRRAELLELVGSLMQLTDHAVTSTANTD